MKKNQHPDSGGAPHANVRKARWSLSAVWVVPVVAAMVAGYLVYQRLLAYGPTIHIRFKDVSGVRPGQTPMQYRGLDIGEVSAVALNKDRQSAEITVRLRREAASVAKSGSVFWIVRPQLGMGNFTGLGTLITGPYIGVEPGEGARQADFTGEENAPSLLDPRGLNVTLESTETGSLRAGAPIYYRGIEVGAIRETRLGTNASVVEILGVVRRRYAPLVRTETKFWNVTGLDVRVGLFHGAEVNMESLKSLIIGGIAFATPDDYKGDPVKDGTAFRLYDKAEKEWEQWRPPITLEPEGNGGAEPPRKAVPVNSLPQEMQPARVQPGVSTQ